MTTYETYQEAAEACRRANRQLYLPPDQAEVVVIVEGPEDAEYTVMDLREAIAAGFSYEWVT